jgi:hypothetical protein
VIVGEGRDTDACFAVHSIYVFFIVFGSTLRTAVVPLLGSVDEAARAVASVAASISQDDAARGFPDRPRR